MHTGIPSLIFGLCLHDLGSVSLLYFADCPQGSSGGLAELDTLTRLLPCIYHESYQ